MLFETCIKLLGVTAVLSTVAKESWDFNITPIGDTAILVLNAVREYGLLSLVSTTLGAAITVVDASAEAAVQVLQAGGNATVAALPFLTNF